MNRYNKIKILFCIKIFFGLCNVILSNEDIFQDMSLEEKRSFFGTPDGSVPEFELAELVEPPPSKRSSHDTLNITLKSSITILNIVQDHDLVGRKTTDIWFAKSNVTAYHNVTYTSRPDILEGIGEIDFFQNVNDSSAVTRFRDSTGFSNYMGLIKGQYVIKSAPSHLEYSLTIFPQWSTVRRKSINSTMDQNANSSTILVIFKISKHSKTYFRHQRHAQSSILQNLNLLGRKRQNAETINSPRVVYPKLIISPDYALISQYEKVDDLLMHLIAHFNIVDALYRQLHRPKVRLQIVGIIIPTDIFSTPYIEQSTSFNSSLNGPKVLYSTNTYFLREKNRFPFTAYDIIIVMTKNNFNYVDHLLKTHQTEGLSFGESACSRVQERLGGAAIVKHDMSFKFVVNMAHHLSHIFGVNHDYNETISKKCRNIQGYPFVITNKNKGPKWSKCSKQDFRLFFRSEKATCMYKRSSKDAHQSKNEVSRDSMVDRQYKYFHDLNITYDVATEDATEDTIENDELFSFAGTLVLVTY